MFCRNCGQELPEGTQFCSKCGKPVEQKQIDCKINTTSENADIPYCRKDMLDIRKTENIKKEELKILNYKTRPTKLRILLAWLGITVILAAGAGYTWYSSPNILDGVPFIGENGRLTEKPAKSSTKEGEKIANKNRITSNASSSTIENAQKKLEEEGLPGHVKATSYGHSTDGFLSVSESDKQNERVIFVWDNKNQRVGAVMSYNPGEIVRFSKNENIGSGHILLNIILFADVRDQDADAGVWKEDGLHYIPVYAEYTVGKDGVIVPGKLTTGSGERPAHFSKYLYEQKNVDFINLILTELPALQTDAAYRQVSLSTL